MDRLGELNDLPVWKRREDVLAERVVARPDIAEIAAAMQEDRALRA
jgi:hypothetical protein